MQLNTLSDKKKHNTGADKKPGEVINHYLVAVCWRTVLAAGQESKG